jgi:hypothetical protein
MVSPGRVRRFLSDSRVSFEMPFRVSKTPWPERAEASKAGQLPRLSEALSSSTESTSLRSRLLYCRTSGIASAVRPISARFSSRFLKASTFACVIARCESADEHHAVDALEHQLPGGVVEHLAGHRVELDAGLEAGDRADVDRQEVEEEGTVGLGFERNHLTARVVRGVGIDVMQVRGLAA